MKKIIIKINFILMLGILICGMSLIGGFKPCESYASNVDKKYTESKNENKENKVQEKKERFKNIKPEDIEEKKLKKVVIGPNTRKKLKLDKNDDSNSAKSSTVSQNRHHEGTPVTLNITFYTDLDSENGGCGGYVSNNKKIAPGMVASTHNYGTRFYIPSFGKNIAGLEGINIFQTEDRMAEDEAAKASNRMDIYVPRLPGESDDHYLSRVNNYGRYSVKAFKL